MSTSEVDTASRAELIRRLFVAFPMGATEERVAYYLQETAHVPLLDLAAGVARAGLTLETQRAPPLATLMRLVKEVKSETLREQDETRLLAAPRPRPLTADELDQCRMVRKLGREGWYWCCETGQFQSSGRHRTAAQTERAGMPIRDVTREQIYEAYAAHCGGEEVPF